MVQRVEGEEKAGLRAMAMRAYAEALMIGEMQRQQAEANQRKHQLEQIEWYLEQQIGIKVCVQEDPCEVDGLWFTYASHHGGDLMVLLACPACRERNELRYVGSLQQLGELLETYGAEMLAGRPCPECEDRELREHYEEEQPTPDHLATTEDQLLAALDGWLRERVRELIG